MNSRIDNEIHRPHVVQGFQKYNIGTDLTLTNFPLRSYARYVWLQWGWSNVNSMFLQSSPYRLPANSRTIHVTNAWDTKNNQLVSSGAYDCTVYDFDI